MVTLGRKSLFYVRTPQGSRGAWNARTGAELSPRTFCTFPRDFSPFEGQGAADGRPTSVTRPCVCSYGVDGVVALTWSSARAALSESRLWGDFRPRRVQLAGRVSQGFRNARSLSLRRQRENVFRAGIPFPPAIKPVPDRVRVFFGRPPLLFSTGGSRGATLAVQVPRIAVTSEELAGRFTTHARHPPCRPGRHQRARSSTRFHGPSGL